MKTVRLDPTLEAQAVALAEARGITFSELIRQTLQRECLKATDDRLDVKLAGIVGCASSGGSSTARKTGKAFREILARKRGDGR